MKRIISLLLMLAFVCQQSGVAFALKEPASRMAIAPQIQQSLIEASRSQPILAETRMAASLPAKKILLQTADLVYASGGTPTVPRSIPQQIRDVTAVLRLFRAVAYYSLGQVGFFEEDVKAIVQDREVSGGIRVQALKLLRLEGDREAETVIRETFKKGGELETALGILSSARNRADFSQVFIDRNLAGTILDRVTQDLREAKVFSDPADRLVWLRTTQLKLKEFVAVASEPAFRVARPSEFTYSFTNTQDVEEIVQRFIQLLSSREEGLRLIPSEDFDQVKNGIFDVIDKELKASLFSRKSDLISIPIADETGFVLNVSFRGPAVVIDLAESGPQGFKPQTIAQLAVPISVTDQFMVLLNQQENVLAGHLRSQGIAASALEDALSTLKQLILDHFTEALTQNASSVITSSSSSISFLGRILYILEVGIDEGGFLTVRLVEGSGLRAPELKTAEPVVSFTRTLPVLDRLVLLANSRPAEDYTILSVVLFNQPDHFKASKASLIDSFRTDARILLERGTAGEALRSLYGDKTAGYVTRVTFDNKTALITVSEKGDNTLEIKKPKTIVSLAIPVLPIGKERMAGLSAITQLFLEEVEKNESVLKEAIRGSSISVDEILYKVAFEVDEYSHDLFRVPQRYLLGYLKGERHLDLVIDAGKEEGIVNISLQHDAVSAADVVPVIVAKLTLRVLPLSLAPEQTTEVIYRFLTHLVNVDNRTHIFQRGLGDTNYDANRNSLLISTEGVLKEGLDSGILSFTDVIFSRDLFNINAPSKYVHLAYEVSVVTTDKEIKIRLFEIITRAKKQVEYRKLASLDIPLSELGAERQAAASWTYFEGQYAVTRAFISEIERNEETLRREIGPTHTARHFEEIKSEVSELLGEAIARNRLGRVNYRFSVQTSVPRIVMGLNAWIEGKNIVINLQNLWHGGGTIARLVVPREYASITTEVVGQVAKRFEEVLEKDETGKEVLRHLIPRDSYISTREELFGHVEGAIREKLISAASTRTRVLTIPAHDQIGETGFELSIVPSEGKFIINLSEVINRHGYTPKTVAQLEIPISELTSPRQAAVAVTTEAEVASPSARGISEVLRTLPSIAPERIGPTVIVNPFGSAEALLAKAADLPKPEAQVQAEKISGVISQAVQGKEVEIKTAVTKEEIESMYKELTQQFGEAGFTRSPVQMVSVPAEAIQVHIISPEGTPEDVAVLPQLVEKVGSRLSQVLREFKDTKGRIISVDIISPGEKEKIAGLNNRSSVVVDLSGKYANDLTARGVLTVPFGEAESAHLMLLPRFVVYGAIFYQARQDKSLSPQAYAQLSRLHQFLTGEKLSSRDELTAAFAKEDVTALARLILANLRPILRIAMDEALAISRMAHRQIDTML